MQTSPANVKVFADLPSIVSIVTSLSWHTSQLMHDYKHKWGHNRCAPEQTVRGVAESFDILIKNIINWDDCFGYVHFCVCLECEDNLMMIHKSYFMTMLLY